MEIYEWISTKIDTGELAQGEKIYSENQLIELFSVSRQTVRQALSRLEADGKVVRRRGSGTYVRSLDPQLQSGPRSRQIAVVTTYIDEYIFPKIIQSIEKTIFKNDYTIQVAFTHNSVELEEKILSKIKEENIVSGLIIESARSAFPNPNLALYEELLERGIPVVFLNSYYRELQVPHVSMDDRNAGKKAAEYLIEKGHKKIGAIFKADDGQGLLRYEGYIEALRHAGLPLQEDKIQWMTTGDVERMLEETPRYLSKLKDVTACVCYNDTVASRLMEICRSEGIRIPEDLSVVGIDDADLSGDLPVPLTTIHNPLQRLGRLSAELILKMINGEKVKEINELKGTLVERNSVRPYIDSVPAETGIRE